MPVNSKTPEHMTRLTAEERERAIGMVQLGVSYAHVARILNCTKLTITRLIQRYMMTGRTADRPRSGRPRVTTANEDCHLRILHLHKFLAVTSSTATALGHVISHHTVCRRLRQHGIRAYQPFKGMALTRQHRLQCLRWAHQFQRWQHLN